MAEMALVQQRQHLGGSNPRQAIHEVLLADGLTGLSEQRGCASHITLGQLQAGRADRRMFITVAEGHRQIHSHGPVVEVIGGQRPE